MNWSDKLIQIHSLKDKLMDAESKLLFDARVNYLVDRNEESFHELLLSLNKNWFCREMASFLKEKEGIIIFGCGYDGLITKTNLEICGYEPSFFCDSDDSKVGMNIKGTSVISVDEVVRNYRNYAVVLGSRIYNQEMLNILHEKGFPRKMILLPKHGILHASNGKQYFDMFSSDNGEVFIDAGAFDGKTVLEFVEWTQGNFGKIIAIEPSGMRCTDIRKLCQDKDITPVDVREGAVWSKDEFLFFYENGTGSVVNNEESRNSVIGMTAKNKVKGITIDSIVGEDKVTYIKMDIEGSELMALEGARETIIKNKPKLAISIYHKPWDIIDIPLYILSLVPEYRFSIRHYTFNMHETVLYATV